ncbi:MAG TPA: hypothetical protein VFB38_17090 [Chthonomonadaceae bacterium]|nr:hypothetical protein [Chthonomonadaceae bacterium]
MARTIYATFPTGNDAERAAGALMDHGVPAEALSYIMPRRVAHPEHHEMEDRLPPVGPTPGAVPQDVPTPDVAIPQTPGVSNPIATGLAQDRHLAEDNTTASTYGTTGAVLPDSKPPAVNVAGVQPAVAVSATERPTLAGDVPIDMVQTDHAPHIIDQNRKEPYAATGISPSTGGDAAKGALEGAGIGIGLGALLGIAAVTVPGFGLVAGAGALIAGLAAATGAAGGIAGGIYGYLTDMGLPPEPARRLSEHMETGGPILSVEVTGQVSEAKIRDLLTKYGATYVEGF